MVLCFYTPATKLGGVYWIHPVCLSVCLFVNLSCLPCSICSSGWILSMFGTNDQKHERVCRMWWPLTLTYIFKVIWPWLRKSCLLCSIYSSGWIIFIFAQIITIIRGCVACYDFFRIWRSLNFWQILEIFRPWPWKKNLQFPMDSSHI